MLYRDAAHVDVGGFYARNPSWGKIYRLLGLLGIIGGIVAEGQTRLAELLIVLVLLWLAAWYQVVGTLWRSSLVAACLLAAARILLLREGGVS
jgi:hypothetical protein